MTFADSQSDFPYALHQVQQAVTTMSEAGAEAQSQLLNAMATALEANQDTILEANTLDLEASLEMAVPELLLNWLKLTPERLLGTVRILRRLATLGDLRSLAPASEQSTPAAVSYGWRVPLGIVALIYESLPELAIIAAGLCMRIGNGLVLKGGNEASQTNLAIAQILEHALEVSDLPSHCILFLGAHQGDAARTSLLQAEEINLAIPYGRPSLIQQVTRQASIPVLPATMGNCYLYWGRNGNLGAVSSIVRESHQGEPDAVNAIEKILIHASHSPAAIAQLCHQLWEQGFRLRGNAELTQEIQNLTLAKDTDWAGPYLHRKIALRRVDSLKTAVKLINLYSSGHADCLVTESYSESQQFVQMVQSATVHINTSNRFCRNPSKASAICLGMTSQRHHGSAYIGLDALMRTQYIVQSGPT